MSERPLLAGKRSLGCPGADDLLKGRIDRLRPSPKGVRQGSIVDASTFFMNFNYKVCI